jgi:L-threonylcarbamoyladenylate synthase
MVDEIFEIVVELVAEGLFHGAKSGRKSAKLRKKINEAAEIIKEGGIVAFPTETVYGLGADAFNSRAVERVYSAKGRPTDNPLILHVANTEQFLELTETPREYALALANKFWPGPLTLIAKKKDYLPEWLGGHPSKSTSTVGVRIPGHPIAKALIEAVGGPIAAPSANKSGKPSPTSAFHVAEDFSYPKEFITKKTKKSDYSAFPVGGEIDMILDGEISEIGIESTVVDVTGDIPVILRPGAITPEMIQDATGIIPMEADKKNNSAPRSPGVKYRHYAPKANMFILKGEPENIASHIINKCETNPEQKIGALVTEAVKKIISAYNLPNLIVLCDDKQIIARNFYSNLRKFDRQEVNSIFAEAVCETHMGAAIMDRMRKAAGGNVINV